MGNAFESGEQKIIPAVLLYAFYQGQVLMLNARGKDGMPGKWNGLGGKLEIRETMKEAAVREFHEEASCKTQPEQWQWLGQLYFPDFKSHKREDWWVTVFVIDLNEEEAGSIPLNDPKQPEGALHFVSPSDVLNLDLWEGDRHFLPLVFKRVRFEGTFFYERGHCVRHELTELKD